MNNDEQEFHNLSDLEKKLYAKEVSVQAKKRSTLHAHHDDVPTNWADEPHYQSSHTVMKKNPSPTIFKKFFISALIFAGIAFLFAGITLFRGGNQVKTENVSVTILGKSFVDGGETQTVQVQVINKNAAPLELADVILEYPKSNRGEAGDIERIRRTLGTVRSGETKIEEFNVTLFGQENELRDIRARLEYRVPGSNAIFVRENTFSVTLRSSPVELVVTMPEEVIPNQEFTIAVNVISNSLETINNLALQTTFPNGFNFKESDRQGRFDNSIWELGTLQSGQQINFSITGTLRGDINTEQVFRINLGNQDRQNERAISTVYATLAKSVTLASSFITVSPTAQGLPGIAVVVDSARDIQNRIEWSNASGQVFSNVRVQAELSGNALDPNTVTVNDGFYDSNTRTVTWDRTTSNALGRVALGNRGSLSFTIKPRILGAGTQSIQNPTIRVAYHVEGIDESGQVQTIKNVAVQEMKLNSDMRVSLRTIHHSGPFQNTGAMPPRVGQETTYTLVWVATNTSNRLTDTKIVATLPNYVTWKGRTAPQNESITYNSVTREITWDLGDMDRGVGFSSNAREVFFQVGITPSISQSTQIPELTGNVVMTGKDSFTGASLETSRRGNTTQLLNDTSSTGADGRIVAQ